MATVRQGSAIGSSARHSGCLTGFGDWEYPVDNRIISCPGWVSSPRTRLCRSNIVTYSASHSGYLFEPGRLWKRTQRFGNTMRRWWPTGSQPGNRSSQSVSIFPYSLLPIADYGPVSVCPAVCRQASITSGNGYSRIGKPSVGSSCNRRQPRVTRGSCSAT